MLFIFKNSYVNLHLDFLVENNNDINKININSNNNNRSRRTRRRRRRKREKKKKQLLSPDMNLLLEYLIKNF